MGERMEHVLVISRALFDQLGAFQGFQPDAERYLDAMLAPAANFFMERPSAEQDPTHKQLIPYSIFRAGDRYLHYQRGSGSGEKRLVAKRSLGVGGHINPVDQSHDGMGHSMYFNSIERELAEELILPGAHTQRVVGLINDDSNDVGAVHLGVVHLFELESDAVHSNEDALTDLQFSTAAELRALRDQFETWSQICLDHILPA
ncbi:MAG: hypothetical protein KDK99_18585 [Verrucomicrobiales bacterium]|nr:hypothetical protein [Verrucomicrobiales bacterium]